MYYLKDINTQGVKKGSVTVNNFSLGVNGADDENILALPECVFSYNFSYDSGVLTDGYGIKRAEFGANKNCPVFSVEGVKPLKIYYYKKYNTLTSTFKNYIMIYADDTKVYIADAETDECFVSVDRLTFSAPPVAVTYNYNGNDVIIFSCDSVMRVYDGSTVYSVEDVPAVNSMCIHGERLFATESENTSSLWFSDDFDPLNWRVSLDEAGFIDLREGCGSLLKVLSFGGYVYVFANYGITRISAYGDQRDFSAEKVAVSSGKIYRDSIVVCGDRVVYLAEDGFYSFNGTSCSKIARKAESYINATANTNAKRCYCNGIYYCTVKIKVENTEQDVLFCYKIADSSFWFMKNLCISDFTVMDGEDKFCLLFLTKNQKYIGEQSKKAQLFSVPLTKCWQSGKSDLGLNKEKTITKISLFTATNVRITVKSEYGERTLNFYAGKSRQSAAVGLKGNVFTVKVQCNYLLSKISHLKIEYEYGANN